MLSFGIAPFELNHGQQKNARQRSRNSGSASSIMCAKLGPTPLSQIEFRKKRVFIKRDDLLSDFGVFGSKVRKFSSLMDSRHICDVEVIVSYGGAQSNAMLALANLCSCKGIKFVYVTRPVASYLKEIRGNFQRAVATGMNHVELSTLSFKQIFMDRSPMSAEKSARDIAMDRLDSVNSSNVLFIPQGGAWPGAENGIKMLARELRTQIADLRKKSVLSLKKPILFLASGTGSTAYFLARHLADIARVVTVPVAGDGEYLVKQMRWLDGFVVRRRTTIDENHVFPEVLCPRIPSSFADIRQDKLRMWTEMQRSTQGEFDFDLVYAPKAWEELFLAIDEKRINKDGEDLFYYHSGGVEGNSTMLDRFRKKGLLDYTNVDWKM